MTATTGNTDWDALFPDNCKIKIEQKGSGVIQEITTSVTNFSDGGGAKSTESIAHFGGAYLTVVKPQEDFEVSFDIDVKDTRLFQIISDDVTAVSGTSGSTIMVKSGGPQKNYKVKLEWDDAAEGGSNMYKIIYYNARGVTFEKDNAADDRLTGKISFSLAPADTLGSGQKYEIETSDRYDSGIGSTITGSYGAYEKSADVLFGYAPGSML